MNKISFSNGLSIFKRVQAENKFNQSNNHQNPFGVSFKGNILTADVFELTNQENISFTGKIAQKGKLFASAMVGSLNKITEPVVHRVQKITNLVKEFWAKVNQIELTQYSISNMANPFRNVARNSKEAIELKNNKSVDELKIMLQEGINAKLVAA